MFKASSFKPAVLPFPDSSPKTLSRRFFSARGPAVLIGSLLIISSLSACSTAFERLGLRRAANLEQLELQLKELQPVFGFYPPRYAGAERAPLKSKLEQAIKDAEKLPEDPAAEQEQLWVKAELYRFGHNADLPKSSELTELGKRAEKTLDHCLQKYPRYVRCQQSAADYYLWVRPTAESLEKTEKSLSFLKDYYKPRLNENVEVSYIYYYLSAEQKKKALVQIKTYLAKFPEGQRRNEVLALTKDILGK